MLGFSKNDNISELELLSKCLLGYGKVKSSSGDFTLSTADLKANEDGDFIEGIFYYFIVIVFSFAFSSFHSIFTISRSFSHR